MSVCLFNVTPTANQNANEKCDGESFDSNEKMCCNGALHKKENAKNACCGNVPYDSNMYSCCPTTNGFKIVPKGQMCILP